MVLGANAQLVKGPVLAVVQDPASGTGQRQALCDDAVTTEGLPVSKGS
jgi:hypothetical protein